MSLRHKPIKIYKKNIQVELENNNFINNRFLNKNNVELIGFIDIDIDYDDLKYNSYYNSYNKFKYQRNKNGNNKSIELMEYIDVEYDGLKDTKNDAFNNIIMDIQNG